MRRTSLEVRLLHAAINDLRDIVEYVALDRPVAAEALADRLERALEQLGHKPHMGRVAREMELAAIGYRFIVVQNYLVFYVVEDPILFVHRVIHGARDYVELLN